MYAFTKYVPFFLWGKPPSYDSCNAYGVGKFLKPAGIKEFPPIGFSESYICYIFHCNYYYIIPSHSWQECTLRLQSYY